MKRDAALLEQRRRAAIAHWRRGMIPYHVAQKHGVSHVSVLRWIERYKREGPRGLSSRRPTGRPPNLPAGWLSKLPAILLKGAAHFGYLSDLWTTRRVAEVVQPFESPHTAPFRIVSCAPPLRFRDSNLSSHYLFIRRTSPQLHSRQVDALALP